MGDGIVDGSLRVGPFLVSQVVSWAELACISEADHAGRDKEPCREGQVALIKSAHNHSVAEHALHEKDCHDLVKLERKHQDRLEEEACRQDLECLWHVLALFISACVVRAQVVPRLSAEETVVPESDDEEADDEPADSEVPVEWNLMEGFVCLVDVFVEQVLIECHLA